MLVAKILRNQSLHNYSVSIRENKATESPWCSGCSFRSRTRDRQVELGYNIDIVVSVMTWRSDDGTVLTSFPTPQNKAEYPTRHDCVFTIRCVSCVSFVPIFSHPSGRAEWGSAPIPASLGLPAAVFRQGVPRRS